MSVVVSVVAVAELEEGAEGGGWTKYWRVWSVSTTQRRLGFLLARAPGASPGFCTGIFSSHPAHKTPSTPARTPFLAVSSWTWPLPLP